MLETLVESMVYVIILQMVSFANVPQDLLVITALLVRNRLKNCTFFRNIQKNLSEFNADIPLYSGGIFDRNTRLGHSLN